jgi:heme-degrading monooxygenase HmoA
MIESFSSFFTKKQHSTHHDDEHEPGPDISNWSDKEHIAAFKEAHKTMEEHAHHLHHRGYNMDIDYESNHAARHGKSRGSTLFYNVALHSPKRVTVSKSALEAKRY